MERSVSNTSLNTSLRRPHNENPRMIREKEPIVPKNPIDLSLADETSEPSKTELVVNEKAVVDDQEIQDMLENMSVPSKTEPQGWRALLEYPKDYFEVSVQYVNAANNTIFVMEQKYEQQSVKLLRSMNRQISGQSPALSPEDIREGCLYAAPYENVYYRAEVRKVFTEKKAAMIRLIDYGNEFECKFSDLKASIPIMKNLNAYGICVRLKTNQKLQPEDVILIKIVDKADANGVFSAEMKSCVVDKPIPVPVSPLQMIMERGILDCFISYIFPEKNAVLATFNDNKVGEHLKGMNKILGSGGEFLSDVKVGELILFFVIFN